MKKFLLLLLLPIQLFSLGIDIHNIIDVEIPNGIEIISVDQLLRQNRLSDQYSLRLGIGMVYANKYFQMRIDLFGYGDSHKYQELASILDEESSNTYSSNYQTADQSKFLKENYLNNLEHTESGIEFSRFVSTWASGWSSDYYGMYFQLNNEYFSEVIINTINIWSAYGGNNLQMNDREFRTKASSLSNDGQEFIAFIDELIESINISPGHENIRKNESIEILNNEAVEGFYIPKIENLRLRKSPDINTEILGYVRDVPYIIIGSGPDFTADGIDGRWLRIKTFIGPTTGWAFSGYMRKITKEEEVSYFEGI